ncbi:hypothetical protein CTheo_8111 [Ceratobasidium theobromae]|uniref:Uncharacterized protein n=1 Tax=Ceratobasidium theobromae TaxID=1582974 RepID=A0A5N5QAM8_9AGAM|nr:hypothetical protein CTheo_8111 [Ceratobasidium theobromae]
MPGALRRIPATPPSSPSTIDLVSDDDMDIADSLQQANDANLGERGNDEHYAQVADAGGALPHSAPPVDGPAWGNDNLALITPADVEDLAYEDYRNLLDPLYRDYMLLIEQLVEQNEAQWARQYREYQQRAHRIASSWRRTEQQKVQELERLLDEIKEVHAIVQSAVRVHAHQIVQDFHSRKRELRRRYDIPDHRHP